MTIGLVCDCGTEWIWPDASMNHAEHLCYKCKRTIVIKNKLVVEKNEI
jgi:hypothetical protein